MSAPRKGGGHSKGQSMPYAVVYAWDGDKPVRNAKWTLGAAEAAMLDTLRAANARGGELEIRVTDRATGETVVEPQRCAVCRDQWATELGRTDGGYTLCGTCDEDDLSADEPVTPAAPELSAPLLAALRAKGLDPSARPDGTVTVTTNDIDWTLRPEPHAVTGEPCGVWSAVGPVGSRGMFGASNAAEFIAQRTTP
jgi:hypothetical protein